ncbi:hypothetical protein HD806DRAFT_533424 [Xylariaceae sp. AK1471]|nr:hypothetical protein HD806DRAFT_533424 [Xylariaceae sp. AK1471]
MLGRIKSGMRYLESEYPQKLDAFIFKTFRLLIEEFGRGHPGQGLLSGTVSTAVVSIALRNT